MQIDEVVNFETVSKVFPNGTIALHDMDFQLNEGERLTLLGASGCGKSTVLRLAAGLEVPTSGQIHTKQTVKNSVSFVFQDPTLMPWADVLDNIAMPLKLAGTGKQERRELAQEFCSQMGLAGFETAYPKELSGGMQMRVSIARSLINKPRLLLMDEPFAALDEITRFALNDLLLELQESDGFSLIFVTHSVSESVYLSDRVLVMAPRPGRIFEAIDTQSQFERTPDYRLSVPYLDLCKQVSTSLNHAIEAGEAGEAGETGSSN